MPTGHVGRECLAGRCAWMLKSASGWSQTTFRPLPTCRSMSTTPAEQMMRVIGRWMSPPGCRHATGCVSFCLEQRMPQLGGVGRSLASHQPVRARKAMVLPRQDFWSHCTSTVRNRIALPREAAIDPAKAEEDQMGSWQSDPGRPWMGSLILLWNHPLGNDPFQPQAPRTRDHFHMTAVFDDSGVF
jgi:hypothetical protein